MSWLGPVQELARMAGFVVPQMQRSLGGRLIESGWICEDFEPGVALAASRLTELVPLVAQFHLLARDMQQRPGFASTSELQVRASGGDVDLGQLPQGLARTCREAWERVAGAALEETRESIVHGDLNASNLILCPDGQIALIDWDECRRDLTLFDLGLLGGAIGKDVSRALLAWEVACSWLVEPARARQLATRL